MKLIPTIAASVLSMIALVSNSSGQTCTCNAPDDSCTISVTCPHGCTAICAPGDACYARCGNIEKDLLHARVTIKVHKAKGQVVASMLSSQVGKKIEFSPKKKNKGISLDIQDGPLWNPLVALSKFGKVTIAGIDFSRFQKIRNTMLSSGKLSMTFNDIPIEDALAKLAFFSGWELLIESGDPTQRFSISLKNVTLAEFLDHIRAQTGVKISQTAPTASMR